MYYSNRSSWQLQSEKYDLNHANSWIKLTQICKRWWLCAKNTKALWCRIVLGGKLKSPGLLASSFFWLSHPLSIEIEHELDQLSEEEEDQMNRFYTLLLIHPYRISALYLRGNFPDMAWDILQVALPNIIEVELTYYKFESTKEPEWKPIQNGEMAKFLGGTLSSLRKLSFMCYSWPAMPFPALTHLHLCSAFYEKAYGFECDLFQILASLSFSLQVLHLRDSGPALQTPDHYIIRSKDDRLVMHALTHLELKPLNYHDSNFLLMHLHNLSLPKIEKIIWGCSLTEDIDRWGMWVLPPTEYLLRVTSLTSWKQVREGCYVLDRNTLYFDPKWVPPPVLETWKRILPNVAP